MIPWLWSYLVVSGCGIVLILFGAFLDLGGYYIALGLSLNVAAWVYYRWEKKIGRLGP